MYELNFITDMFEEQIVKGNLRWLANFNEIHKDYTIGDVTFPIYASGGLRERGFFLSKIYSALVTPKYKVHLLLYTTPELNPKLLRKIIISCKSKFGADDWIFLGLVQNQPFEKTTKEAITNTADKTVGIAAFSLASKETVTSNNVLGKGLAKQLKLTEAKFEAFDLPNYLKGFTMILGLGVLILIVLALSGLPQAIQPLTLLLMAVFSLIAGHRIYKTRYHMTLSLNSRGFRLQEGRKVTEGKWSNYSDVTMYITPKMETCLRLHSKDENFDLPLSRVGVSRKEAYNTIRQLMKKK
ncbi:MAG: hypothetical protein WAN82_05080 [Candidatus Bathyarchaeia archaeon]